MAVKAEAGVAPQFTNLSDMVEHQANVRPAKLALRYEGRETSYAEFRGQSRRAAGAMVRTAKPGARVAYLGKNTDAYYVVLAGAAMAGLTLVPVNWRLAVPEVSYILRDSGCALLFITPEFADVARAALKGLHEQPQIVVIGGEGDGFAEWCRAFELVPELHSRDPEAIVVQMYTSGTTGRPKGALLSQRALMAFRSLRPEAQPEWNRWMQDDVGLIVMPQFHIGGTGFGLQILCAGATGLVAQEFSVERVLDAIEHEGLSKLFTVPSALQMLLAHPRARGIDYERIRAVVYGASPMPLPVLRDAISVFDCGFVQQYGMTEMCGTIAVLPPEDHDGAGTVRMTSAGRALAGVKIAIAGPDGTHLPAGETGEVLIRSPTAMSGYWNLPEATAQAFDAQGFFRSGDAGYLDEGGYLFLRDRIKDMIVSGGENVFPAEVENALASHPAVREVAVIGVPDAKWGEAVKAVVVLRDGEAIGQDALRGWARDLIAGFKVPKSIDFVEALPRNAAGKVLRRELRAPYWEGQERAIA
ncbi:long-chain-fatty-acid--CoA ligase (plasmid) [Novosphingobium resinovorum]|uniref:long-chain-fatty-acid--CoA ligase n=1 Tax=Novosphingobium TaxID=165696 RepID=UPI001B3C9E91|nr:MULTISPECIES: long-chain-fatty-acid--CoA ligase [Novosphingobium]WJM29920.1 long-chain-fatty-acid--CoA ligase [Novosphingobium resinovorum]